MKRHYICVTHLSDHDLERYHLRMVEEPKLTAVVLANSNLIDTLRVDLPLFSRHISCAIGRLCCVVGLSSQPCKPSVGGVGSAPSTHRYAAVCETSEADPCGPVPVGMVGGNLAGLAFRADYRETRDGHRLAPKRLPSLLDVEIPSWPSRSSERAGRNTPTDSQDSRENPLWGAPRIHGELLKLGIDVGETSVSKYMVRGSKPPSQTWRTFLENHLKTAVSVDFFTVPTIRFQVLYVFLVLAHDRRRMLHVAVTAHPTAAWTGQQLREAFPWDSAPRFLLRDRDRIFGADFTKQVEELGMEEVLGAIGVPQQRAYIERVIGTIRRECLDHLIVFNEATLCRQLRLFLTYYHESRTHLSLEKDTPATRLVQPPELGRVIAVPQLGGLHHRYERRAA